MTKTVKQHEDINLHISKKTAYGLLTIALLLCAGILIATSVNDVSNLKTKNGNDITPCDVPAFFVLVVVLGVILIMCFISIALFW
jgi:phosphatidylserine synthase